MFGELIIDGEAVGKLRNDLEMWEVKWRTRTQCAIEVEEEVAFFRNECR